MLLSICIPTKDRRVLLGETLDSVLSQVDDDVEVIVRDNGSTDGTLAYLTSLEPRVRVLRAEKPGFFADNVNGLVPAVWGRFFMLLHDDDLLAPGAIKAIKAGLAQHPDTELLVGTCTFFIGKTDNVIEHHPQPDLAEGAEAAFRRFFPKWEFRSPSTVYRTPAKRTDFYDETYRIAKDSVVLVDYLMAGKTTLVSAPVGFYRMGDHSETHQKVFTAGWGEDLVRFSCYVRDRLGSRPDLKKYRYAMFWIMYRRWLRDSAAHYFKRRQVRPTLWLMMAWAVCTVSGARVCLAPPAWLGRNQK